MARSAATAPSTYLCRRHHGFIARLCYAHWTLIISSHTCFKFTLQRQNISEKHCLKICFFNWENGFNYCSLFYFKHTTVSVTGKLVTGWQHHRGLCRRQVCLLPSFWDALLSSMASYLMPPGLYTWRAPLLCDDSTPGLLLAPPTSCVKMIQTPQKLKRQGLALAQAPSKIILSL